MVFSINQPQCPFDAQAKNMGLIRYDLHSHRPKQSLSTINCASCRV